MKKYLETVLLYKTWFIASASHTYRLTLRTC